MKASYQPRTRDASLSEKAVVAPDVEKPLLFGHGQDLSAHAFSTMYDITIGAKIPPQLAESAASAAAVPDVQHRSTLLRKVRVRLVVRL